MQGSFTYLLNNLESYLQPYEWSLYLDLLKTKDNLKNFDKYDWYLIENDIRFKEIELYKSQLEYNYKTILELVKDILLDKIKKDMRFSYYDENNIKVELWHMEGLVHCEKCGNIWDGCAQCNCY